MKLVALWVGLAGPAAVATEPVSEDAAPVAAPPTEAEAEPTPDPTARGETSEAPPDAAATSAPTPEPEPPAMPAGPEAAPPVASDKPRKPAKGQAHARGDFGGTPLPQPPPRAEPGPARPWRGRLWFDLGFGAVSPVGGEPPGRGRVHSGAVALTFGVRVTPWLGLSTGLSVLVHDLDSRAFLTSDGQIVEEVDLGRMTLFDLVGVRALLPVARRIEPWAEVAATVGPYRAPFSERATAVGGMRADLGFDGWVAPAVTLGVDLGYRVLAVEGTVGHALQPMLRLGLHR